MMRQKSQPGRVLRDGETGTKVWRERDETAEKPDWERVAGSSLIRRESTPQLWMKWSMITLKTSNLPLAILQPSMSLSKTTS